MERLILYFSRAGENDFKGGIKFLEKGNTEVVAEKIRKIAGGTLFKVEPEIPYSDDYNICLEETRRDIKADARPKVKAIPSNMEKYDEVLILYPNYHNTFPMPMFTVLEQLSFQGKIIKPLCTHEGGGLGDSIADIEKICKGAVIEEGLAIRGSYVDECDHELELWLKKRSRKT